MTDINDGDSSVGSGRRAEISPLTMRNRTSAQPLEVQQIQIVLPLAPPCGHLDDDEEEEEKTIGSNSTAPKRAITIRFRADDELATFHDGADIDELAENRQLVWYQYDELKTIKRKALQISKEAQRHGLGVVLTNTYGKRCEETQEALNTWARNGSSRRGLERWINDEYAAKRSDIRKRTIQSVVRAQAKMRDSELNDPDYSSKVLSRLSEAFSIDSKQFARGMGLADELAASIGGLSMNDSQHEGDNPKSLFTSSSSDSLVDDRKAPLRKGSPRSVVAISNAKGRRLGVSRNLGLTTPSVSADFRHYY
ncbi:hypothetical protein ACA910_020911 [Epithemia clementina (nom. ined.)]